MILIDTGPLVALLDHHDSQHSLCLKAAASLTDPDVATTWPCFTEAMYLLGTIGGHHFQTRLWRHYEDGYVQLLKFDESEVEKMQSLMAKYHDLPMDLADASLVAVAETHNLRTVFTLDSDFRIYRLSDGSVLDVIP